MPFTSPRSGNLPDIYQWAVETVRELRRGQLTASEGGGTGGLDTVVPGPGVGLVYPGMVMEFAGLTEPEGWAFCDGRQLEKDGYEGLFAAIGDRWSPPGTPADLFCLPDFQGRASIWVEGWEVDGGLFGGQEEVFLTEDMLPEVDTGSVILDHTHEYFGGVAVETDIVSGTGGQTLLQPNLVPDDTSISTSTVALAFGSATPEAIPTMPPWYSIPRIIKL